MEKRHFILGRGELLTADVIVRHGHGDKRHPYTLEESIARLSPEFKDVSSKLDELPALACPNDLAVEAITLNPCYLARSYYPVDLFDRLSVSPLGSRSTKIVP